MTVTDVEEGLQARRFVGVVDCCLHRATHAASTCGTNRQYQWCTSVVQTTGSRPVSGVYMQLLHTMYIVSVLTPCFTDYLETCVM